MCKLHGILKLTRYYNPIHFQIIKDRVPQVEQKNIARSHFIVATSLIREVATMSSSV